ncbi:hypothetical protein [Jiella pelagia]|uniref:Transcriptional regulator n=1 Tax=Jiella pelagia TaxID=2986949 RepID=A0ABY7BWD8_9HYPH|nr:hypothetical protein [Jiella pelagia]WAP67688.1 hypothetical protein OH818_19725 [Jiella pelagia]
MTIEDKLALAERDAANHADAPTRRPLELDADAYMSELDGFDMTEAQKRELLQTLWSIMRSFVDLGFEVDICAAVFGDNYLLPEADSPSVDSSHTHKPETR